VHAFRTENNRSVGCDQAVATKYFQNDIPRSISYPSSEIPDDWLKLNETSMRESQGRAQS
jgi:hypothetical protein